MMVAILVTPPLAPPVSRDEAKAHARIDSTAEDDRVDALINAASIEVENRTGRALVSQNWRIVRDAIPRGGIIRLTPVPVATVDAVTIYTADGTPKVLDPSSYEVDVHSAPGRLRFKTGGGQRARALNGVEVDLTCGYGEPDAVPAPLKQAVLMLVSYWFEQREAALVGAVAGRAAESVAALLAPYRMPRIV